MKTLKSLAVIAAITAIHLVNAQEPTKANVHRPHKSHNYQWVGSAWTFMDSTEYQYNVQGQITSSLSRANGNYTQRSSHTYDHLFQLLSETTDAYDVASSSWKPANKTQMTYNEQFDVTLHERALYTAGDWEIYYGHKYSYQYNTSNQITEKIEYVYFDNVIEYRENFKFSDIVYDSNNNILEQTRSIWPGNQNQWVYDHKYINTYNPDNTIDTQYVLVWNTTNNSWENEYLNTFTYGANGSYVMLAEYFSSGSSEISYRKSEEYDAFQNLTRTYSESWDNVANQWVLFEDYQYDYLYDVNDYMTQEIHKYWNVDNQQAQNYLRKDYFEFETFDSQLGIESPAQGTFSIYPNPMETACTIDWSKLNEEVKSVRIFDLSGNVISELPLTTGQKITFSKNDLTKGLYFVEVETAERKVQSKIMVK